MYSHITSDTAVLGGKPCVAGTRLSVEFVLELYASGADRQDILRAYPQLTNDAIDDVLKYAAASVKNEIVLMDKIAA